MLSSSELRSLSTEVSSILTYDIFYTYIQPELKEVREGRKTLFYSVRGVAEPDRTILGPVPKLVVYCCSD